MGNETANVEAEGNVGEEGNAGGGEANGIALVGSARAKVCVGGEVESVRLGDDGEGETWRTTACAGEGNEAGVSGNYEWRKGASGNRNGHDGEEGSEDARLWHPIRCLWGGRPCHGPALSLGLFRGLCHPHAHALHVHFAVSHQDVLDGHVH